MILTFFNRFAFKKLIRNIQGRKDGDIQGAKIINVFLKLLYLVADILDDPCDVIIPRVAQNR